MNKIVKWAIDFNKQFPTREFRPTVMNSEGKSVIITRYVKPIKPPEDLIVDNNEASSDSVVNYQIRNISFKNCTHKCVVVVVLR